MVYIDNDKKVGHIQCNREAFGREESKKLKFGENETWNVYSHILGK